MALDICLIMDRTTEDTVRSIWQLLAERGVTSPLLGDDGKPHLSLAIWDDADITVLRPSLEAFAAGMEPFPISYPTLGTFGTASGTLYLGPVYSPSLMEVHRTLHGLCGELTGESNEHYRPLCWVPHCSLSLGLTPGELAMAFETCLANVELPMKGWVRELGMIEFDRDSVLSFDSFVLSARTLT